MTTNDEVLWTGYVGKVLEYIKSLSVSDYLISDDKKNEQIYQLRKTTIDALNDAATSTEAFNVLARYLKKEPIEVLRVRYRSHKYRQSNQKKTIIISDANKSKIKLIMDEIGTETVDKTLEFLMGKSYPEERDEAKERISETFFGDELDQFDILLKRISKRDQLILEKKLKEAFKKGWESSRSSRSRKRDAKSIAATKYINNIVK